MTQEQTLHRTREVLAKLVEQIHYSDAVDDLGNKMMDNAVLHEAERLLLTTTAEFGAPVTHREVYCEDCGSNQPMVENSPRTDERNLYPWYEITCGSCAGVIATVQIVPEAEVI